MSRLILCISFGYWKRVCQPTPNSWEKVMMMMMVMESRVSFSCDPRNSFPELLKKKKKSCTLLYLYFAFTFANQDTVSFIYVVKAPYLCKDFGQTTCLIVCPQHVCFWFSLWYANIRALQNHNLDIAFLISFYVGLPHLENSLHLELHMWLQLWVPWWSFR